jgi:hypothetical protein
MAHLEAVMLAAVTTQIETTERREAARLRSERWRRAHGIGPRRPAQQPSLGILLEGHGGVRRDNGRCLKICPRQRPSLNAHGHVSIRTVICHHGLGAIPR